MARGKKKGGKAKTAVKVGIKKKGYLYFIDKKGTVPCHHEGFRQKKFILLDEPPPFMVY